MLRAWRYISAQNSTRRVYVVENSSPGEPDRLRTVTDTDSSSTVLGNAQWGRCFRTWEIQEDGLQGN
eukprot:scaffold222552_cov49-Prasinocladus_malaysianus.AAC.5